MFGFGLRLDLWLRFMFRVGARFIGEFSVKMSLRICASTQFILSFFILISCVVVNNQ